MFDHRSASLLCGLNDDYHFKKLTFMQLYVISLWKKILVSWQHKACSFKIIMLIQGLQLFNKKKITLNLVKTKTLQLPQIPHDSNWMFLLARKQYYCAFKLKLPKYINMFFCCVQKWFLAENTLIMYCYNSVTSGRSKCLQLPLLGSMCWDHVRVSTCCGGESAP